MFSDCFDYFIVMFLIEFGWYWYWCNLDILWVMIEVFLRVGLYLWLVIYVEYVVRVEF